MNLLYLCSLGTPIAQSVTCLVLTVAHVSSLANLSISGKISNCSCSGMYPWVDCHFRVALVSQGISWPNVENCSGFPLPLDSLTSRIAIV